jgi:hypothetical protein
MCAIMAALFSFLDKSATYSFCSEQPTQISVFSMLRDCPLQRKQGFLWKAVAALQIDYAKKENIVDRVCNAAWSVDYF